jgi:hypothetical protein
MRPTNVVLKFIAWGESEEKAERVRKRQKLRTIREYIDNVATVINRTKTMFTAEDSAISHAAIDSVADKHVHHRVGSAARPYENRLLAQR